MSGAIEKTTGNARRVTQLAGLGSVLPLLLADVITAQRPGRNRRIGSFSNSDEIHYDMIIFVLKVLIVPTCFRKSASIHTTLLLHVLVEEGGPALAAVVTIVVLGHEAANPGDGAVLPEPHDLPAVLDPVILEGLEGGGLVHPLRLLGLGVHLLLPLLPPSAQAQHEVQRGLLLDVVIREGASVLELLPGEDETLLIGGDALLVLDLRLDVVDGVRRLDIEGDGLACFGGGDEGVEKETTKLLPDASQPVGGTIDNEKEGMEGWRSATFGRGETVRDMMTRTEVSCHGSESEIVIYIGTAVTTRQGRGEAEEKGERWGRGGGGGLCRVSDERCTS